MTVYRRRKVQVWIYRLAPFQVLLLKTNRSRGAFWQPVTGSVEDEESLPDAALREGCEESGLEFVGIPLSLERSFKFESSYDGGASMTQFEEWGFALEAKA